jgi:hypothetical protein
LRSTKGTFMMMYDSFNFYVRFPDTHVLLYIPRLSLGGNHSPVYHRGGLFQG